MKRSLILGLAIASLGSVMAYAHPHDTDKPETSEKADKKTWPYFGDKSEAKDADAKTHDTKMHDSKSDNEGSAAKSVIEKHFKQHANRIQKGIDKAAKSNKEALSKFEGSDFLESPDDIREAARALEDMLAESDLLENMAEMFIAMAENIEVDTDDDGLTLRFDGETLGSVHMKRDKHTKDNLVLEGLGQNIEIDKEVVKENGKTRTRIVIEMDGGEDIDIDVSPNKKSGN